MAEVVFRSGVVVRLPLGAAADAVTRLVTAGREGPFHQMPFNSFRPPWGTLPITVTWLFSRRRAASF